MYLKIGEKQYSVSRRVVTEDTIKYLSVTPAPGEVTGKIQMYRDDGFLLSEDDAGNYTRQTYAGTLLTLTNKPVPEPAPQPSEPSMKSQYAAAMRAYAATSTAIPDTYALDMPDLFPSWAVVLADGEELPEGRVLNDGGQLYRVVQAVTPQAHQAPHDEGMLAVYRPIDREHAGTADDPIPWVYGMDCHAGKCYRYNGKVYQVAEGGDMIPCTWPPDTPGMWQWEEVQA